MLADQVAGRLPQLPSLLGDPLRRPQILDPRGALRVSSCLPHTGSRAQNKSLNIFNSRLVLASPETASDDDYARIEGVVAHEYFHSALHRPRCLLRSLLSMPCTSACAAWRPVRPAWCLRLYFRGRLPTCAAHIARLPATQPMHEHVHLFCSPAGLVG